ncbi:MAG: efflux RND transporter periplasmic adaptor subunit [Saprospiraceae bacterium]|nr:efflux RND transporter periplasmic adaptor subunit [Saprospiraceae bacterium]
MRKKLIRNLAIFLSIVIFGGAIYLYSTGYFSKNKTPQLSEEGSARPAAMRGGPGEDAPTPVEGVTIKAGSLYDVIYVNGSTVPNEEVVITSEVPGKITQILFKEGSYIKKGAAIVQLDIAELKAQRERLLVQQQLTQKIAERLEGLYKKEGVSLQEYEIARAEADQVDAELGLIDVQLSKRSIKSPFDGLLGLRQVSEGSYMSPGTPIVSLVSTNPINIEFAVPERYSQNVDKGTKVTFRMDGTNDEFSATVIAKEPNIDATTRTLKLKATAPNPSGKILPGAYVNVTVNLRNFNEAIMIPTQAIVAELEGKKVYVYKNGKAEQIDIETGIRRADLIQVTKGLNYGDTVITTGILQIRPGASVEITKIN